MIKNNMLLTSEMMSAFDITTNEDVLNSLEVYHEIGNGPFIYVCAEKLMKDSNFIIDKNITTLITIADVDIEEIPNNISKQYYFNTNNKPNYSLICDMIYENITSGKNILLQSKYLISDCMEFVINFIARHNKINELEAYKIAMNNRYKYSTDYNYDCKEINKLNNKINDFNF